MYAENKERNIPVMCAIISEQACGQLLMKVISYNCNYFVQLLLQLLLKITITNTNTISVEK